MSFQEKIGIVTGAAQGIGNHCSSPFRKGRYHRRG